MSPPFGNEAYSVAAAEWASTYGLFHWGLSAWGTFCMAAVPVSYSFYVRKVPILRLSTTCIGIIGEKNARGIVGKIIDVFVIIGMLGGIGTTIGLGTPMVSAGISKLLGINQSFTLEIIIVLIWACLFGASVFLGLEKGIKRLSNINIYIAFGLLAFAFVLGPTSFMTNTFVSGIGKMFQNFIEMSLWTDSIRKSGFPQSWTVFYWAWWIAYIPSVGLFIAKISKGQTLKQLILGTTVFGSIGCWIYYAVFGNYSMYLQLNGLVDVTKILSEDGGSTAIITIIETLPFAKLVLFTFLLLAFISLATTLDSAAYTLSAVATKELKEGEHPTRWHRLFWAFALAALPLVLMFVGGLEALQTTSVVFALPLSVIMIIMTISFVKNIREDYSKDDKKVDI